MQTNLDDKFILLGKVAREMGIHPETVVALVRKGILPPPQRIGQGWVFLRAEIERLIREWRRG